LILRLRQLEHSLFQMTDTLIIRDLLTLLSLQT
jgi:hypothetical protein